MEKDRKIEVYFGSGSARVSKKRSVLDKGELLISKTYMSLHPMFHSKIRRVVSCLNNGKKLHMSNLIDLEIVKITLDIVSQFKFQIYVDELTELLTSTLPSVNALESYLSIALNYLKGSNQNLMIRNIAIVIYKYPNRIPRNFSDDFKRLLKRRPESQIVTSFKKYGRILRVDQKKQIFLVLEKYSEPITRGFKRRKVVAINNDQRHEIFTFYGEYSISSSNTITFSNFLPMNKHSCFIYQDSCTFEDFTNYHTSLYIRYSNATRTPIIIDPFYDTLTKGKYALFPKYNPLVYVKGTQEYPFIGYDSNNELLLFRTEEKLKLSKEIHLIFPHYNALEKTLPDEHLFVKSFKLFYN
uniref:Uncharacterized protein n=1 Tax=Pithovirus LCDPAC01 TaxID=2506600 RepID=A0A481YQH9_9VIRU|nr:MAG: hypothetical protein LCDPAC01_01620 [Pithovirus LCDPAC01]